MASGCPRPAEGKPASPLCSRVVTRGPSPEAVEEPPASLLDRLRAEPDRAPEIVALAAAERFAPPAGRFSERLRAQGHPPEEIAHQAVRRHTRMARAEGAVVGAGGVITVVPDLVALAWLQSRMVFFVAAAHGFDPAHPMRPAELLALQDLYDTPAAARAALDRTGQPIALAYVSSRLDRGGERTLQNRLVRFVSRKMALRVGARVVPLLSAGVSAVQNGRMTADLGARALTYYGG